MIKSAVRAAFQFGKDEWKECYKAGFRLQMEMGVQLKDDQKISVSER